jgi:hypothetical protein
MVERSSFSTPKNGENKLMVLFSPFGQGCKSPFLDDYLLLAFISRWCSYGAVGKLRSGFGRHVG